MAGLECGHMFCALCWNEYLNTKILEENIGQHIFCPATNCNILVDENFVRWVQVYYSSIPNLSVCAMSLFVLVNELQSIGIRMLLLHRLHLCENSKKFYCTIILAGVQKWPSWMHQYHPMWIVLFVNQHILVPILLDECNKLCRIWY